MKRRWSGNARRLSQADRAQIESPIWGGATFETQVESRWANHLARTIRSRRAR